MQTFFARWGFLFLIMSSSLYGQETWITVFVHGTIIIKPTLLCENLAPLMRDKAKKTRYGKTVACARKNPILHQNQAMLEEGLRKIDLSRVEQGYAAGALAHAFERINEETNPGRINHYYAFGWSGLISRKTREQAAFRLYTELSAELEHYRQQGIVPKIKIIGYSHGGNVCLNLAQAARQNGHAWHVDELLLIATPIQNETDYLIADPFFKKSYSFFSGSDRIQQIDFFSYNRFFSNRQFTSRKDFTVPATLTQVRLKVRKHLPSHLAINTPDLDAISKQHRALSPGHAEFWFFGWTPKNYRKRYPFHPLPTAVILPYIITHIEELAASYGADENITVTIAPAYEQMIITYNGNKEEFVTDFITTDELQDLKELVMPFKPRHYDKKYERARESICAKGRARHKRDRARYCECCS